MAGSILLGYVYCCTEVREAAQKHNTTSPTSSTGSDAADADEAMQEPPASTTAGRHGAGQGQGSNLLAGHNGQSTAATLENEEFRQKARISTTQGKIGKSS